MEMEIGQLVAFDRIVREGSFGRAALALGIGQPAVSSRIQGLERALGGPLFVRGRRVALTALGDSFLPYARRSLEVLAEGAEAARLAQVGERGRVTLGCLASLAGGLAGPALTAFVRAHPAVACMLRAGDHETILALLLDGIVEMAVLTWPCPPAVAADLEPLLLLRERVELAVPPRHPLASQRRVTRADVARLGRPLLRLRWWQSHHPELIRLAEQTGSAVEVAMEAARQLLLGGVGCGFFVRTYLAEDLARGSLVTVPVADLPPLWRDSALVRRRRPAPPSPAAAALVTELAREARKLGLLLRPRRADARKGP
jgi:DNA-binding transcriptional LysR family regulator